DPDVVGGDADVGGDGDLGAAPEGVAVEGGDDRHGKAGDPVEEAAHAAGHGDRVLMGADGAELLEVATRDEGAVSPTARDEDRGVRLQGGVESDPELVDGGEA